MFTKIFNVITEHGDELGLLQVNGEDLSQLDALRDDYVNNMPGISELPSLDGFVDFLNGRGIYAEVVTLDTFTL